MAFLLLTIGFLLGIPSSAGQEKQSLPPVSWICPMTTDADVVEDKPGKCPKCGMTLVPTRLDLGWSCPVHPQIVEAPSGKCRICKRDLVQITVSLYWTCPGSDTREIEPGRCPDGSPRVAVRERRAHGDHNPRHGGLFFMASDNWHHLEGTYPRAGVFRVFLYDDFTRPLALAEVTGRAVTRETFDPALKKPREIDAYALRPSKDGTHLEAQIPSARLPLEVTAKLRFTARGEEYRFDFVFPKFTNDPPVGTTPTPMPVPTAPTGASTTSDPSIAAGTTTTPVALPDTTAGLLGELAGRTREIESLIQQGAFTQVYVPAIWSKDLALALEAHASELPEERRPGVSTSVKRVVLASWLLDLYGDLGNKQKLMAAYHSLAGAVGDLTAAYAANR